MDVVWSSNLQGIAHGMETRNPKDVPSFNGLRNKQSEINSWYKDYAAKLSGNQLNETIKFTGPGSVSKSLMNLHSQMMELQNLNVDWN